MPFFRLLAAGGIDAVFSILVIALSIGAAIVNAVNKKNEPPARNPGGRPNDQRVRQEIQEFLQQQSGGRKSRPVEVSPDEIELVEEAPRRRPSPVVKPTRKPKSAPQPVAQQRSSAPKVPAPRASAPPTQISRRGDQPLGSSDLGMGLREHVATAMAERVSAQAQRDLPHLTSSVDQQDKFSQGAFTVSGKTEAVRSGSSSLIQMLQNPKTARQAILMSEIMGRPKALRK